LPDALPIFLGHRLADRFELAELLEDLRFGPAEGLEQNCHGLLALAVEANADLVALVDLELQPGTTGGDDLRGEDVLVRGLVDARTSDRKSTCLNSSHVSISYAVFCLKKKKYPSYN